VFKFGVRQQLLSSVNQTDRRHTVSIRYLYNYMNPYTMQNNVMYKTLNKQSTIFKLSITSMYKLSLHITCTRSVIKFCPQRQIPNRLSVFSVFNCQYSVFFGIVNTDVGVGIGISKYRISVRYFGIPTQDYSILSKHYICY